MKSRKKPSRTTEPTHSSWNKMFMSCEGDQMLEQGGPLVQAGMVALCVMFKVPASL